MDLILAGRKVRKAPRSKELVAAQGSNVDKPRRTDHYLPKESFAEFAIPPDEPPARLHRLQREEG